MNASDVNAELVFEQPVPAAPQLLSYISDSSIFNASPGWHWHWSYIVGAVLASQAAALLWNFWWKAPSNLTIAAYPTPLGRWVTALCMIFNSEALLQKAYDKSGGKPFAIPMTDRWIVFISDRDQLKRLECEPESVLSSEEALHELALTEPILGHHQVPPEHKGPKSESFRVTVGVLKNKLRSKIPAMSDSLKTRIKEAVALELAPLDDNPKQNQDGWREVRLMPALLRSFNRVNVFAFFGEDEANRSEVFDNTMNFFWSCAQAFPILALLPGFLLPIMGPVAMGFGLTRKTVYNHLRYMTWQALEGQHSKEGKLQTEGNISQWTAEMAKIKDAAAIAKITLGFLFASAFQVPMVAQFCIYNLCKHPQFYDKLKAEAVECKDMSFGSLNQEMPYFDSFVKETARLSPGPILSAPRTVMVPYTSSDGYHVPVGNWLAIPQISLMRDESIWPRAMTFEAFRFVDEDNGTSKSRLTHPSYEFPFWGSIQHACPARFYVSVIMKMILSHLILDYEIKLADPTARPFLIFGKVRLPNPFTTILVRKRAVSGGGD
ncbi:cytochrome P450 [Usnea florida]